MTRTEELIYWQTHTLTERREWAEELLSILQLPETYAHPFFEELCLDEIYKDL